MAVSEVDTPETSLSRLGPYQGVISQLRRRLTVLDLLPTLTMEGASFAYTPEGGSLDTAAETGEGQVKPEGDVLLPDATCVARTIAHFIKVRRQQLADLPTLATTLNSRLSYGVERRLETQILNGDGIGENLLGILHTSGIGAPASVAGDTTNADLALDAIVERDGQRCRADRDGSSS